MIVQALISPLSQLLLGIALNCSGGLAGISIHEKSSVDRLNSLSLVAVQRVVEDWLHSGTLPQDDFRYFVQEDGLITVDPKLKLIKLCDITSLEDRRIEVSELSCWLKPERAEQYLFGEDVRGTPLPQHLSVRAQHVSQSVWRVFNKLYGDLREEASPNLRKLWE